MFGRVLNMLVKHAKLCRSQQKILSLQRLFLSPSQLQFLVAQNTRFFISNTFISNTRLSLVQRDTSRLNFCYLKIIPILHLRYHPKVSNRTYEQKNKCVCIHTMTLREKCPNMEFFLVRIFPHSDQKKLCLWTLFTQC